MKRDALKDLDSEDDKIIYQPQLQAVPSLQQRSCHNNNKDTILQSNPLLHHVCYNLQRVPLSLCSFKPPRPVKQLQPQRYSSLKPFVTTATVAHKQPKAQIHTLLSPLKKQITSQNNSIKLRPQIKQVIPSEPPQNQVKFQYSFSDHSLTLPIANKNEAANINNLISADSVDTGRNKFRFSKTQVFFAKTTSFENQETIRQTTKMPIVPAGDNTINRTNRNLERQEKLISSNDKFNQTTFRINPFNQQFLNDSPQYHQNQEEQKITQDALSNAATMKMRKISIRETPTDQQEILRCLKKPPTHKILHNQTFLRPSLETTKGLTCLSNQQKHGQSSFKCKENNETLNNSCIRICKSDIKITSNIKTEGEESHICITDKTKTGNGSTIQNKEDNNKQSRDNPQKILNKMTPCNDKVRNPKKYASDNQRGTQRTTR